MLRNTEDQRRRLYVKKDRSYNLFHNIFPPILQSFIWQLYDIVVRSFLWQLYDIVVRVDKIKFETQN